MLLLQQTASCQIERANGNKVHYSCDYKIYTSGCRNNNNKTGNVILLTCALKRFHTFTHAK